MGYKIITAVASPVLPLADLRQHLRLDLLGGSTHPDDTLIEAQLGAAREHAEHYTQRSIGVQTLELALDAFPAGPVELPLGAASISSVKYLDAALVEQTLVNTAYTLDDYSPQSWLLSTDVWPATGLAANAVKVRYVTKAALPQAVKAALMLTVSHLYEHREAINTERGVVPTEVPLGVKALLDTCRLWNL